MKKYEAKKAEDENKKRLLLELKGKENVTLDGKKINLYANIGGVADVANALSSAAGCDLCAQTPADGGRVIPAAQECAAPKAAFRASASTDTMRLGYCVDEPRLPGLMLQDDGLPHAVGAAIELDANLLDKYVGDQNEAVEIAIDPARGYS